MGSYTTAALVQAEINASAAFTSLTLPTLATVNNWISEESTDIDLLTNDTFASTAVTSEVSDYNGSGLYRFPKTPLISVDKVEYNLNSEGLTPSWVTLQAGADYDYLTYLTESEIEFVMGINSSSKIIPLPGKQNLRLSYTHGFATPPLSIQKLCTLLVVKRVLNSLINDTTNIGLGSIDIGGMVRIAEPGSFSLNRIRAIDDEIKFHRSQVVGNLKVFKTTRVYDTRLNTI